MQSKTTSLLLGIALGTASTVQADTNEPLPTGKVETPFGEIAIEQGLPATPAEVQKLVDQLDFQQATQSYLWALPIVAFAEWQEVQEKVFGATDHDLVLYSTYADRLGILTGNATTPYLLNFFDLGRSGPIVIQLPPGPVAGGLSDFWQREMGAVGELGPDKGKGGKFIVVAPGKRVPAGAKGYRVLRATTVNFFFGLRALDPDPKKAMALIKAVKVYPYSQRTHPPATRLISPEGKQWYGGQPHGMDYWKRLHAILQVEPVAERDRFYMAMLANVGIEKGKPFAPGERQTKILSDAAVVGDLMAQSNSFAKRFPSARHWPDRRWNYVLDMSDSSQRAKNYDELMERTAYFYEAVTYSNAMITKTPGAGQAYLGAYTDKDGWWLDGDQTYTLHVPANPPAKLFWSITVYDSQTRALIDNPQQRGDRSSRDKLTLNADGSVDLYFGPNPRAGFEDNWVQTIPGRSWFCYLRLYGPLEAYFDKSWKLNDIELID